MADYIQWRNKNSYRAYPIADDASWVTTSGLDIPADIFIDAAITPIDPQGGVWVSLIDFNGGVVEISDDDGLVAAGSIGPEVIDLYDSYSRHIGIIVVSETFSNLSGTLEFQSRALPLAPSAVIPQTQQCVRGFILPDGTVVTGDVSFVGIDGITISTEYSGGLQKVRFDALGDPSDGDLGCVTLPPPVKCIEVSQVGTEGILAINLSGNVLTIDTTYQLADVCKAKSDRVMISEEGTLPLDDSKVCDEEEVEVPCADSPDPVAPQTHCGNELYISIASTLIGTEMLSEPGIPAYGGPSGTDALPEREQQGLKLFLRSM